MNISKGFFVVQDSKNHAPFVVAWFQEKFDAIQWVKNHEWVDLEGGGGEPFGLSLVPNTPEGNGGSDEPAH
jgi:hypothetical protein